MSQPLASTALGTTSSHMSSTVKSTITNVAQNAKRLSSKLADENLTSVGKQNATMNSYLSKQDFRGPKKGKGPTSTEKEGLTSPPTVTLSLADFMSQEESDVWTEGAPRPTSHCQLVCRSCQRVSPPWH
ncbi:hypothetical protein J007_01005 [Cryptococcus neoformans]|nr:hypothetical protein J007_01005 [Cryptococcus neoformans var. grubii]OXC64316.1 hypothetical protein C358_01003 [Cryptococcus neoformans var. grubii MW-RSA852]